MELNNRHAGSVAASSSVDRVKFLNEATVNMHGATSCTRAVE